ncbi:MAG: DEAD/DEAH box helicase [Anaerolineae bacterium]|nr:DEAD/DEAH box helicase [Anaerolineae bacterium]
MHILHGTWLPDLSQFTIWGEDTAPPLTKFNKKKREHPFALDTDTLLRYLFELLPQSQPNGTKLNILLPSTETQPQPSPEAIAAGMQVDYSNDDLRLQTWLLPQSITLQPVDTLSFLLNLPNVAQATSRFVVGSDLRFWQRVALLLTNALIEGRYQPMIMAQGTRYETQWQLAIEEQRQAEFANAMPALCRAMVDAVSRAPAAVDLLEHYLNTTLHSMIPFVFSGYQQPDAASPFLNALISEDRVLREKPSRAKKLYESWRQWLTPETAVEGNNTFRLCFRLDEPADERELWLLVFMLQATDDPSLLVEAMDVWNATGRSASFLNRRFDQPQESFLRGLGTASRLFVPIEISLREAKPIGVVLTTEQAFQFLLDAVPKFEKAGFGVLVPNWWQRRAKLKARAKMKGKQESSTGILNRDALVDFRWELALGDQPLTESDFEELVRLRQPFVRIQGQWVALDPQQITAMLEFLRSHPPGNATLLDAVKLSTEQDSLIEIETPDAEGWLLDILQKLQQPDLVKAPPIPRKLNATLRHYQERGFGWLAHMQRLGLGACLADQMGLGKTLQTIALWLHGKTKLKINQPRLLVCPTSVVGNWRHELTKFAPALEIYVHQGADRVLGDAFTEVASNADVVLTSYALMSRDLEVLKQVKWSSITLDEAQNIKNPTTKTAQAARALQADHRLALTGTPVENRLTELWSIMQFLNPGYLYPLQTFREKFAIPIERYGDADAAAALRRLTQPFILRRLKTDPKVIDDLPEKFENKVYCTLSQEQASLYEATVRDEMEALEQAESPMKRRGSILRMLTRLKQICNHPVHFLKEREISDSAMMEQRSGKLTRLTEMLDEVLSAGDRALIFTQYAEMGRLLTTYLRDTFANEVLFLFGDTPVDQRMKMVERFQSPAGPPLFILSLKAGGTGLNLTNANYVFHFDRWYNPAVEDQATDRAFRIGQTRNVQVHKFVCLGTLEERIDELIEKKRGLADKIIDEGEGWIAEMSDAELRDLVTLRRDAVSGE